jgi:hypothetical protein
VKFRLALAGAVAAFVVVPVVSAHASTCSPAFQDLCYRTCNLNGATQKVCSLVR